MRCFASKKNTGSHGSSKPFLCIIYLNRSWWSNEISFRSSNRYCSMLKALQSFSSWVQSCLFGSSSFVSLNQVTLSSLSEQQAMALQQRALSLLTDTQPSFVDSLVNIYQLSSMDPAVLRLHVVRLQALSCHKEVSASFGVRSKSNSCWKLTPRCFSQAAVLGTKLQLQKELDMEEVGQNIF